jgi:acetylornithine deacetylase/succinyl-diaminopimelate desuccinylase-like protein
LRKFLKRILPKFNFKIIEDNYVGRRDERFSTVHNLLAIRGNPQTCLVAHTDVCRDHAYGSPPVNPVFKQTTIGGELRNLIQDEHCKFQVGGDDRLGVAINTWIALNTGYDLGLLFTTDEEIGVVSADYVSFPELLNFEILLQTDRGNHTDQLVTSIGCTELCSKEVGDQLIAISEKIGLPRYKVNGMLTDVLALKSNGMCRQAVNMTCGYHNSYGSSSDEYIDIQEAKDTMKFVSSIIKHYYLGEHLKIKKYYDPESRYHPDAF